MTTLHQHQAAHDDVRSAPTEVLNDGLSAAALITSWVGATFPLLPAVAFLVAIAGRKRSATRWLNTTAIVVSAAFLAAQVAVAALFGASLMSAADSLLQRDSTTSAESLDDSFTDDLALDDLADVKEIDPALIDEAPAGDSDLFDLPATTSVIPGDDAATDTAYFDTMSSALEDTGYGVYDFDETFLYDMAVITCQSMDMGSSYGDASQYVADQDIPSDLADIVTTVAIVTYCPEYPSA